MLNQPQQQDCEMRCSSGSDHVVIMNLYVRKQANVLLPFLFVYFLITVYVLVIVSLFLI